MATLSRCLADEFEANVRQRRKDCVKDSYLDPTQCDDRQGTPPSHVVGR